MEIFAMSFPHIAASPRDENNPLLTSHIGAIFDSPEFYPLGIDFQKRTIAFVRMSQETYRNSVFLDSRTQYVGKDVYESRVDDILLRDASVPAIAKRVCYILHPTFSCSTLLARYFELIPSCLVLKEPMLLTQMALVPQRTIRDWSHLFHISVRLLTRTYCPGDLAVIKVHEPCNALADRLLDCNDHATIIFLISPLRQFVLAVLKSQSRRDWVRTRIPFAAIAAQCPTLMHINTNNLNDAQAAAYLWLVNRFIYEQLHCGRHRSRVHLLNGNCLADSPETTLRDLMPKCEVVLDEPRLKVMIHDPSIRRYSKDLSRPYRPAQRREEMAALERCFSTDADGAMKWAASFGMGYDLSEDTEFGAIIGHTSVG
jgi:hypothetical protein